MADFDTRSRTAQAGRHTLHGFDLRGDVGAPTVTELKIISLRPPQFGIPLAARHTFLTQQLPNGVSSYIALFSTLPSRAGLGGVEASGSGYARVAHSAWRGLTVDGFIARRANVGEVVFPTLSDDLTVVGWGAYDSPTGGTLLAFGLLRNVDGKAKVFELISGDDPKFLNGELQIGIQ